jgi:NAD(P)H-flavin reductase/ferredoxin
MTHQISIRFEDGVTRFLQCEEGERITDAAIRARLNIPLDCRDGVCGTCKAVCESGEYVLGDCVEDALSLEEASARKVLTCQMSPRSDCVIQIATNSDVSGTGPSSHKGRIVACQRASSSTIAFSVELEKRADLRFLPGQYVNIQVPGTDQTRSYSFSSGPSEAHLSFLVRNVRQGVMSTWLCEAAKAGDPIEFRGPMGSFYLRPIERPVLFLAGGTGLAPFLSMLDKIVEDGGSPYPIHMILGVNSDDDLVGVDRLDTYAQRLPNFTYACTVSSPDSAYPHKGFVTHHINASQLNDGDADLSTSGVQLVLIGATLGPFLGVPVYAVLSRRMDKRKLTIINFMVFVLGQMWPPLARLAGLFPESAALVTGILFCNALLAGSALVGAAIGAQSMMADAVDEHEHLFGVRREGLFFSGLAFAVKAASGLGGFLAGASLDIIRFPTDMVSKGVDVPVAAEIVRNLGLFAGPVPALVTLLAPLTLLAYRLTRKRHAVILHELEARRFANGG